MNRRFRVRGEEVGIRNSPQFPPENTFPCPGSRIAAAPLGPRNDITGLPSVRHSEEAARPTWESVLLLPRQPPERKKSCQENRPPDNILLAGKLRYFRIAELCDRLADFFCIMR